MRYLLVLALCVAVSGSAVAQKPYRPYVYRTVYPAVTYPAYRPVVPYTPPVVYPTNRPLYPYMPAVQYPAYRPASSYGYSNSWWYNW